MILVDTSIWVDYLRNGDPLLAEKLLAGEVATHNFVIGELALGGMRKRSGVLDLLRALPRLSAATDDEVIYFIGQRSLSGKGIGYVDAHLLAAAAIHSTRLWTRDQRLHGIAEDNSWAFLSRR
ncbi:MAG: PIN domain-containing protein [Rhodocyclales bacterium]|nr:PIN domain-containing protein [Rhodocyclales bacterium]